MSQIERQYLEKCDYPFVKNRGIELDVNREESIYSTSTHNLYRRLNINS